jgi:two-component sensor histidine kinase
VSDNGPGFPADFDAAQTANLGLALVDTLARHDLGGEVLYSNDSGARVDVTFPLAESGA